jgi:hypothetical protein
VLSAFGLGVKHCLAVRGHLGMYALLSWCAKLALCPSQIVLHSCRSVVGIELVRALRARVEDRRSLISATRLSFTKLHLWVVTLGTFFVGDLLRARNVLGD